MGMQNLKNIIYILCIDIKKFFLDYGIDKAK